MDLQTIVNY